MRRMGLFPLLHKWADAFSDFTSEKNHLIPRLYVGITLILIVSEKKLSRFSHQEDQFYYIRPFIGLSNANIRPDYDTL